MGDSKFIIDLFELMAAIGIVCCLLVLAGCAEYVANWSKRK